MMEVYYFARVCVCVLYLTPMASSRCQVICILSFLLRKHVKVP